LAADDVGSCGRFHPGFEFCHGSADPDDLAAVFMALYHWIGIGERVFAVVHVYVGAADADAVDLQEELVGLELAWRRDVPKDHGAGLL
jgi:hypothetical protein